MNNIFSQLMGGLGGNTTTSTNTSSTTNTTTNTSSTGGQQRSGAGGMFNSAGGIQDLMQQMLANPGQLEGMLNAPYMQPMLQSMASNPEMTRLLVENNPQLANNPEMREQVMRALPNMMSQVNKLY